MPLARARKLINEAYNLLDEALLELAFEKEFQYGWYDGKPLSYPVAADRGNGYYFIVREEADYPADSIRFCYPPLTFKDTSIPPKTLNAHNPVWYVTREGFVGLATNQVALKRENVTGYHELP